MGHLRGVDEFLDLDDTLREKGGQSEGTLQTKNLVNRRAAQVRVHQQSFQPGLSDDNGQVGGQEGLSLGRDCAGDRQQAVFIRLGRQRNGGAERAKALGRVRLRVEMGLQITFEHAVGFDVGDVTQERQAEIRLNVVLALDGVIQSTTRMFWALSLEVRSVSFMR